MYCPKPGKPEILPIGRNYTIGSKSLTRGQTYFRETWRDDLNLHNAVTVSQHRLGKRVAQLSSARMNEVCAALRFSLGCDTN